MEGEARIRARGSGASDVPRMTSAKYSVQGMSDDLEHAMA